MRRLFIAVALIVVLFPSGTRAQGSLCFNVPGILNCIEGRFREYWQQNGGLPVFGYPITAATQQTTAEGTFLTQYFERNRFELHPEQPRPYDVLLGRLGDDQLKQQGRDWTTFPKAPSSAAHYFAETGHGIAHAPFWTYWSTHGLELDGRGGTSAGESLALFGLPLSEPQMETNSSGDSVLTQWFERARFEDHGARGVLLGLLGNEVQASRTPPAPIVLRGNGNQATQLFDLPRGLFLVESRYTGRSNFIVHLLDAEGDTVEYLANEIGDATVTVAAYIANPGKYLLEVDSQGSWVVIFRQPTPAEINGGPRVPTTITGRGNKTLFITVPAGLLRFSYSHTGRSNFIVHINDLRNRTVEYVANEIGNATGSSVGNVEQAGPHILEVDADGDWSIQISQ